MNSEIRKVQQRNFGIDLFYLRFSSITFHCVPTQQIGRKLSRVARPSNLIRAISALWRHILWPTKTKADLLDINSGCSGDAFSMYHHCRFFDPPSTVSIPWFMYFLIPISALTIFVVFIAWWRNQKSYFLATPTSDQ